jgi:hypothetical protein
MTIWMLRPSSDRFISEIRVIEQFIIVRGLIPRLTDWITFAALL